MGCPKCGSRYIVIGDKRVCPRDGHVAGYKQINIVEVINNLDACRRQQEYLLGENERLQKENSKLRKMYALAIKETTGLDIT